MWRVRGWRLSWSSTRRPSRTGSGASTIASGGSSCASAARRRRAARRPRGSRARAPATSVCASRRRPRRSSSTRSPAIERARSSSSSSSARSSAATRRGRAVALAGGAGSRPPASARASAGCGRRAGSRGRLGAPRRTSGSSSVNVAALARRRCDADLAAEQARDLAADRQPEARCRRSARLVVPSACWKASKMSRSLSSAMPMPVSTTGTRSRVAACRPRCAAVRRSRAI